jgi:DNA modification methylase
MSTLLARAQANIRAKLAQSAALDQRSIENDIRARRLEAEAGHAWALQRDRIVFDCKRRGITEAQWCREELDCDISLMRRRRQLWQKWNRYISERQKAGVGAGWGLMFALALVADRDDPQTNARGTRVHSAIQQGGACRIDISQGDCLDILPTLPAKLVQLVVSSPPYFRQRDYDTAEWAGGDSTCEHMSDRRYYTMNGAGRNSQDAFSKPGPQNAERLRKARWRESGVCIHCGAEFVDQQIGQEATVAEYVENVVRVMREVSRVLKDDGVAILVLGDTYSGGGRGGGRFGDKQFSNRGSHNLGRLTTEYGPKQLLLVPHRVAIALQQDGWIVRNDVIAAKRNPMPEPVTDRCTSAHEHVLILAKNRRYYWDQDAIREPATEGLKGANAPDVWWTSTESYGSHRAVMPVELAEKCIKVASRPGDAVLDMFAGVGTTGLAANRLGRDAVLIELSADYVKMAKERLSLPPD